MNLQDKEPEGDGFMLNITNVSWYWNSQQSASLKDKRKIMVKFTKRRKQHRHN